jgi:hypothetical protein
MSQLADDLRSVVDQRPFWEQISVQQFLGSVNWDNVAQKPSSRSGSVLDFEDIPDFQRPDPNAPLSLSLTISQFMTAVNWDGVAMMEVSTPTSSVNKGKAADRESAFTLNDFSDMF